MCVDTHKHTHTTNAAGIRLSLSNMPRRKGWPYSKTWMWMLTKHYSEESLWYGESFSFSSSAD